MSLDSSYDAVIIGSGQAGTPLATAFAKAGQKTVLIESTHIAGCCVNEGCTPTKTLITSGRVAHLTRRGPDYGIHTSEGKENQVLVDMTKVRQRKRDIVDSFRGGSEKRLKDAGVEVLMGKAGFVSPTTIHVMTDGGRGNEKILEAKKIFINVGERPAPPKLEGIEKLEQGRALDSTSIQELDAVPERLIVIGGGYVGVEFAQLFGRLGSAVTVVQRGKQLLPREDKEVAEALKVILEDEGVVINLKSEVVDVQSVRENGSFTLNAKISGKEVNIEGTHILFAAGRIPNSDSLNLKAAGVETNAKGYIVANEFLQTTAGHIYVLGDAKGPPAFTHISYDDFRIIKANLLSESTEVAKLSTTGRLVPYVVYTDPQLGHVGLHEHEAKKQFPGRNIKTAKMPMAYVARALETDESKGLMKAVVDGESGEILGFTCLGIEGGEVMAVVQMAMMGGVRYQKLQDAVWAHPSLAESLNNLWGFLE